MGTFETTEVPLDLLQHLRLRPIPATVSGSNQVTFTLNASVTNPVRIWAGDDFISLKRTLTYTWTAASNTVLSSAAAETTQTGSTLGFWYFYIDDDGSQILPSQTAPSFVEHDYQVGVLGHPGTSAAKQWVYVGPHICTTAATPVFLAATKTGYWWNVVAGAITGATPGTSYAAVTLSAGYLPGFATDVRGSLETGAAAQAFVAIDTSGNGEQQAQTSAAGAIAFSPFALTLTGSSIYAKHATAAGDVHVTSFKDLV